MRLVALGVLVLVAAAHGGLNEPGVLKGLRKVGVTVSAFARNHVDLLKLTEDARRRCEAQLKEAGVIAVDSSKNGLDAFEHPSLRVEILSDYCTIELHERAQLRRSKASFEVVTWQIRVPRGDKPLRALDEALGEFVADYTRQNPSYTED